MAAMDEIRLEVSAEMLDEAIGEVAAASAKKRDHNEDCITVISHEQYVAFQKLLAVAKQAAKLMRTTAKEWEREHLELITRRMENA